MSKCFGNIRVTKQPVRQKTGQSRYVIIGMNRKDFAIYGLKVKRQKRKKITTMTCREKKNSLVIHEKTKKFIILPHLEPDSEP